MFGGFINDLIKVIDDNSNTIFIIEITLVIAFLLILYGGYKFIKHTFFKKQTCLLKKCSIMGVGENHKQKCLWFFSYAHSKLSAQHLKSP